MKRISFLIVFFSICMFSCSEEDSVLQQDSTAAFDRYTIDHSRTYTSFPQSDYSSFATGNIVDKKKHSLTSEGQTTQQYFYSGDQLTSTIIGEQRTDFYYGAQQHLIAINRMSQSLHYRYHFISDDVVYVERLNLPYDNPDAQPVSRYILKFDADDNVISAGPDRNFDNILDSENLFVYEDNDLISAAISDGTTLTFEYSDIIDNFANLDDNTYSKKIPRLMCAESYAGLFRNSNAVANFSHSKHLLASEALGAEYEVFGNGFYQTKVETRNNENPEYVDVVKTEFFLSAN